jgi:hypothetical protein
MMKDIDSLLSVNVLPPQSRFSNRFYSPLWEKRVHGILDAQLGRNDGRVCSLIIASCFANHFLSGLALESMATVLTIPFIPFFMITWVICKRTYVYITDLRLNMSYRQCFCMHIPNSSTPKDISLRICCAFI